MICDLAETYGIFEYRRMPGRLLGILVSGLRSDSRCVQALTGQVEDNRTMILAGISDKLSMLGWDNKGQKPEMLTKKLLVRDDDELKFQTAAEYEAKRKQVLEKINGNGIR